MLRRTVTTLVRRAQWKSSPDARCLRCLHHFLVLWPSVLKPNLHLWEREGEKEGERDDTLVRCDTIVLDVFYWCCATRRVPLRTNGESRVTDTGGKETNDVAMCALRHGCNYVARINGWNVTVVNQRENVDTNWRIWKQCLRFRTVEINDISKNNDKNTRFQKRYRGESQKSVPKLPPRSPLVCGHFTTSSAYLLRRKCFINRSLSVLICIYASPAPTVVYQIWTWTYWIAEHHHKFISSTVWPLESPDPFLFTHLGQSRGAQIKWVIFILSSANSEAKTKTGPLNWH